MNLLKLHEAGVTIAHRFDHANKSMIGLPSPSRVT